MMNQILSSNLVQIIQHACWKAFWTRNALRIFLKQHCISDTFLSTWENETKKQFLERLFEKLINQKNNTGYAVILKIGQSLAEMTYFPDLEHYEDSPQKIADAREAIRRLKEEIDKINQKLKNEEQGIINRKNEDERLNNLKDKESIFESLKTRLDTLVSVLGTQQAGYDFEKWFYELAIFNDIPSRQSYKDSDGRQVDGSITIDGTTFLLETKFVKDQVDVTAIDSFCAKIKNKADNTMGLLVAMSGFQEGAIKSASKPGTTILLIEGSHIYNLVLRKIMTLPDVIRRIKRHASQTGNAYLPAKDF